MEDSSALGSLNPLQKLLFDADVQRSIVAYYRRKWERDDYSRSEGFAALVEAIARNDKALEAEIFRVWGIQSSPEK